MRRRIFRSLQQLISIRKTLPALAGQDMELVEVRNDHVLCFVLENSGNRLIVVGNFSSQPQTFAGNRLRTGGLGRFFEDAITKKTHATSEDLMLAPYEIMWLCRV